MDFADYESMFLGVKDVKLFYKVNKVENPKAAVVFVHGICEHLGRYEFLKDRFNEVGYNVYRYDARGHGKSEGKRGYLEDLAQTKREIDTMTEDEIELLEKELERKLNEIKKRKSEMKLIKKG